MLNKKNIAAFALIVSTSTVSANDMLNLTADEYINIYHSPGGSACLNIARNQPGPSDDAVCNEYASGSSYSYSDLSSPETDAHFRAAINHKSCVDFWNKSTTKQREMAMKLKSRKSQRCNAIWSEL